MSDPAEALRSAAIRHLTRVLTTRRFWNDVPWDDDDDELWDDDGDEASATVEALVAVGALSAEEGRAWRERLERAAAAPPPPDPDVHAQAVRHLEGLASGEVDEPRLGGAIDAFRGAGLITAEEEKAWLARLPSAETLVETSAMRVGIGTVTPEFDDSAFVRTVLGPEERVAGLRVTVVEIYEGGVVINWHWASDGGPEAEGFRARIHRDDLDDELDADFEPEDWAARHELFRLADDLGTRYRSASSGWSADGEKGTTASGYTAFGPAAPAAASFLEVVVQERPLRVELGGG